MANGKTTAQKIAESQAGFKSREQEAKIEATQTRREERKITPERQRQIDAAARSTNVRVQKAAGQTGATEAEQRQTEALKVQSAEFRGQLESGFGGRTGIDRDTGFFKQAKEETTPRPVGDQIRSEIGGISKEGPTPEQAKAIAAVEDFNKNFNIQQEQTKAKTEAQLKRGTFTGGTPASQLFGDLEAPGGALAADAPDVFKEQLGLAGGVAGAEVDTAFANQEAAESLRERKLRDQLSKLSLGDESGNVLQALEGQLGQLSLPQLEELAGRNGLELTDSLKESLSRDGKSAIEREKITKEDRVAENEYSKRQLSRTYDRAITDREEFNLQQDARLRRLAASFGGGKSSTIGSNVAVMKEAEKGQRAADDLRSDFADKTMLVSRQADSIIETYGNNVQIIEGQMADAIENKYAEITNTIDDLMDAGITNELELNNAILKAKKDYVKTYTDVSTKAFEAIEKQNKTFFDQQITLREQLRKEEGERATNRFTDSTDPNRFISSQTRNNQTVQDIGAGQPFTRDDGTQGLLGENCVKYARSLVPTLPFGLNTTADKKRAVEQFGFTDREQVQIGDVVLTAEGSVGHAAVITAINEDGTYTLDEANYTPGRVTRGGQINSSDAKILGFISGTGGMSVDTGPFNVGGNVELEGTQAGIEAQMNEPEGLESFSPQIQNAVFAFESATDTQKGIILDEARAAGVEGEFRKAVDASAQSGASQIASDIFNLRSTQRVKDLPQAQRALIERELNKKRDEAIAAGDFGGILRASAGGDKLDTTAVTRLSKTATVINQLGLLQEAFNQKDIISKADDSKGEKFDIAPIKGFIDKKNPWNQSAQEISAILQGTIPNLARGVFGEVGVLTDRDIELYRNTLPNLTQPKAIRDSITAITLRTLRSSLENELELLGGAGNDVSGLLPKYEKLDNKIKQIEASLGIEDPDRPNPFLEESRIENLRTQLQNPTQEQSQQIEQARSQIDNLNSTLVLRDGQFTELFPGEQILPTDIEL